MIVNNEFSSLFSALCFISSRLNLDSDNYLAKNILLFRGSTWPAHKPNLSLQTHTFRGEKMCNSISPHPVSVIATKDNNNHHNNHQHNLHHQQLREELQFKKPMVFRARAFLQKIGLGKSQVIEKKERKKD